MSENGIVYEVGSAGDPEGVQTLVLGASGAVFAQAAGAGPTRALGGRCHPELVGWLASAASAGGFPAAAGAPASPPRQLTVTADRAMTKGALPVGAASAALDAMVAHALGVRGAPQGRGTYGPFTPTRPRRWTPDATLGVPDLGALWDFEEKASEDNGGTVGTHVRARAQAGVYFFLAKDYTVPAAATAATEKLGREILPQIYARNYTDVVYESSGLIEAMGRVWHEAKLSFRHTKVGAIKKVERVCAIGPRVLLVSAEGEPEMFDAFGPIAKTWFAETVHLAPLG